jgi:outer membrane protein TolC
MPQRRWATLILLGVVGITLSATGTWPACAQEQHPSPRPPQISSTPPPAAFAPATPVPAPGDRPMPIDLVAALRLANAQAIDINAAAERERVAVAVLDQARVQWLPTITLGGDYNRHDGKIQNADGAVIDASRSSWMYGAGAGIGNAAIFSINDAIFVPLAAKQTLRARQADIQTARNDTLVAVTDAYFNVQQARGQLAGDTETTQRTENLLARIRKLAPAIVPELEVARTEAELARRQQAQLMASERWQTASAELLRVLRVRPDAYVEPLEPPHLRIEVVSLDKTVDDLIAIGLLNRPELASQKAQVQVTLALLKQEKFRPLIPSLLIRGWSTPVAGTLAVGQFGGGTNGSDGTTGARGDFDIQLLWQLNNLGFGNAGAVRQRQAENRLAVIELFRVQDRVATEVAQAYAQATLAAGRVQLAEKGVKLSQLSADKNLEGLSQPKVVGGVVTLIVRPQEVLASVQALTQAYYDYYGAVADYDRAQFHLYHALGHPAQALIVGPACSSPAGATSVTPPRGSN